MKFSKFKLLFTFLFCLSSIHFFDPTIISTSFIYYIYLFFFIVSIVFVFTNSDHYFSNSFSFPVILILIAELLSSFNATISWDQDFIESIRAVIPYMVYILFFLLISWKYPIIEIEKLIVIIGFSYILVFLISFYVFPSIYFGNIELIDESRGFQRLKTSGIGFLFLLCFYSLNQFIIKKKLLWIFVYFISLSCIFMSLTRTYIIFTLLFSFIYILNNASLYLKLMSIFLVSIFLYIFVLSNAYNLMAEETDSQVSYAKEDIRMLSVSFYLNNFSPNIASKILGNGEPGNIKNNPIENSYYSKFVNNLEKKFGFYISDIGYLGLYVKFGIFSIISYLIFIYLTFKTTIFSKYLYSKYYLFFIFSISFIIDAPFNTSFISSIVFAYYILFLQSKQIPPISI